MTGERKKMVGKGKKSRKIVMAFGAFDGVHAGHLHYLKKAKALGDYLVVSVARDNASWKFPKRYSLLEGERKALVEGLGIADKVILGSEKDSLERISQVKPSVIAITSFHPVDAKLLSLDLEEKGLKAKVVVIKPYKPKVYSPFFGPAKGADLMGLPAKK